MDPARNVPQRAFNRWTLEPIAFLFPVLFAALSFFAIALTLLAPGDFVGFAVAILVFALLLASTLASLRKKR